MVEPYLPIDSVVLRRFPEVPEDGRSVRDGLGLGPRSKRVSQGGHVRVRANAGIPEEIPGSAKVVATLEDGVGSARTVRREVVGGANPGDTRADDQYIKVFERHACKNGAQHRTMGAAAPSPEQSRPQPLEHDLCSLQSEMPVVVLKRDIGGGPEGALSVRAHGIVEGIVFSSRSPKGVGEDAVRRAFRGDSSAEPEDPGRSA